MTTDMAKDYQEAAIRMLYDEFNSPGFSQPAVDKLATLLRKADELDALQEREKKPSSSLGHQTETTDDIC